MGIRDCDCHGNFICKICFCNCVCVRTCARTHTHTHTHTHTKCLHSCPILCNPIDCSLPGSSVHGVLLARVGCHALLQGIYPTPGIEPVSLMSPALAGRFFTTSTTWEVLCNHMHISTKIKTSVNLYGKRMWKRMNTHTQTDSVCCISEINTAL